MQLLGRINSSNRRSEERLMHWESQEGRKDKETGETIGMYGENIRNNNE